MRQLRPRCAGLLPPVAGAQRSGASCVPELAQGGHRGSSCARGFVDRFSGSNQAIADYLIDYVLALQAPEVRDFLLRSSVQRNLDASICQAQVPKLDAARILLQLDEQDLFLVALTGDDTYRYCSLRRRSA